MSQELRIMNSEWVTRMGRFLSALFLVLILVGGAVIPLTARADDTPTQAQLEQQLKDIENQIAELTKELAQTQTQKVSLANKIKQLQAQQKTLTLQIKETSLKINSLSSKISVLSNDIDSNIRKQQRVDAEIAVLLRQMNSVDNNVMVALFMGDGLSSFFNQIKNYAELTDSLMSLQIQNQAIKSKLTDQRGQMENQKSDADNLLKIKSIQQQGLKSSLGEQTQLLVVTKGKESNYQAMISDNKKRAAEIRSRIYELFNTGTQINFGQAVDIAKWVAGATGIRAAFLLAILTQESNLGKNVGTCNRAGDPPEKSWKVIMKPERDQEPFKTITDELGFNIDTTPVSCPMHDKTGKQMGWGGAMGPAQFIPSTWMGYRAKVTKISGKSTANPWDIRDAFLASAIKLTGDGADGTDHGDWKAAMRYFSGSTNTKYRFYGDNVIATTQQYLKDISEL